MDFNNGLLLRWYSSYNRVIVLDTLLDIYFLMEFLENCYTLWLIEKHNCTSDGNRYFQDDGVCFNALGKQWNLLLHLKHRHIYSTLSFISLYCIYFSIRNNWGKASAECNLFSQLIVASRIVTNGACCLSHSKRDFFLMIDCASV